MEWTESSYSHEYLIDEDQKVLGEIYKPFGERDLWLASTESGQKLGRYLGRLNAKKAVEQAINENLNPKDVR